MLTAAALAFINHLLTGKIGEAWATARPRPFAGRTMYVRCPPDDPRIVRVDIDIAAQPVRRRAQRGRAVFSGVSRAARAFARHFSEYFSEKISLIVGQAEKGALARAINTLPRDSTSPEQRLGRLGGMEIRTCADPQ